MAAPLVDPQLAAWAASDPGTLPPPSLPPVTVEPSKQQIRLGMELAAAFLVVRHLISQRLGASASAGDERDQAHLQWVSHQQVWLRLAVPAIERAMALRAAGLDQAQLEAAALDYTTRLGAYLDASSAEALAEGLQRQLGAKWDRQLSWARVAAGYGLDRRQMAAWIAGVLRGAEINPVDPIPAPSRAQLDTMLMTRADRLGVEETSRAVESGKALAWLVGYRAGVYPPGTVKEWDCTLENTCGTCSPLHRQQVAPDQPFVLPDESTVWSPTLHPGCKCQTHLLAPNPVFGKRYDPAEARDWHGRWAVQPQPAAEPTGPPPPPLDPNAPIPLGPMPGQNDMIPLGEGPIPLGPMPTAAPPPMQQAPAPAAAPPLEYGQIEWTTPEPAAPPAPAPPAAEPEEPGKAPAAGSGAITFFTLDEIGTVMRVRGQPRIAGGVPWNQLMPEARVEFGLAPVRTPWSEATPAPEAFNTKPGQGPARLRQLREPQVKFVPTNRLYRDLPGRQTEEAEDAWYEETAGLRADVRAVAEDPAETKDTLARMFDDEIKMIYQLAGGPVPVTTTDRIDGIVAAMAEREEIDPQLASAFVDYVSYVNPMAVQSVSAEALTDSLARFEDAQLKTGGEWTDLPPVQNLLVFDEFAPGDDAEGVAGNYRVSHVGYASTEDSADSTSGVRYVHLLPDEDELGKRLGGFVSAFGVLHSPT